MFLKPSLLCVCGEFNLVNAELSGYEILGTGIRVYFPALKDDGRIECIGGKRYGHWQINEER